MHIQCPNGGMKTSHRPAVGMTSPRLRTPSLPITFMPLSAQTCFLLCILHPLALPRPPLLRSPIIHTAMADVDVSAFASAQLSLLDDELQAELAETQLLTSTLAPAKLQRAGLAVLNLTVSSQRTGFGGKTLLELGIDPAVATDGDALPEHGLRVGDICAVSEQPKGAEKKKEREGMEQRGAEGVVTRTSKTAITIALNKEDADVPSYGKLWL